MQDIKLFNKWGSSEVQVTDVSLKNYLDLTPRIIPHSHGVMGAKKQKQKVNVVERLANKLMRSGQGARRLSGKYIRSRHNCGKKIKALQIIEGAFGIVEKRTKENPIQVLIKAVENAGLREDVTTIRRGGSRVSVSVDVSPLRRIDESLKNLSLGTLNATFKTKKSVEEALANELILASKDDNQSYAIKRRNEQERIAKAAR